MISLYTLHNAIASHSTYSVWKYISLTISPSLNNKLFEACTNQSIDRTLAEVIFSFVPSPTLSRCDIHCPQLMQDILPGFSDENKQKIQRY